MFKAVVVWGKLGAALPHLALHGRGQRTSELEFVSGGLCSDAREGRSQGSWEVEEIVRRLGQIRTTVFIPGW